MTADLAQVAKRRRVPVEKLVRGVLDCDRALLGRAITLVESSAARDEADAAKLLAALAPHAGGSVRLGITGSPGAGKSTFIERLGTQLTDNGSAVAVLAVDPSSEVSGGSILADKTRMERLSRAPGALVRPSPAGRHLGGVAPRTRETMLVCEAAGFNVVIVETVGVGQSETEVASMVDFFLLLTLAGAGDDLQTIKRGVFELVDAVAVTKTDGANTLAAKQTRAQIEQALHLLQPKHPGWSAPVFACSSLTGAGVREIWKSVEAQRAHLQDNGRLEKLRRGQNREWFRKSVTALLLRRLEQSERAMEVMRNLEEEVEQNRITPAAAASAVVDTLFPGEKS